MKQFEFLGTNRKGHCELLVNGVFYSFDSYPLTVEQGGARCYPLIDGEGLVVKTLTDVSTGWEIDLRLEYDYILNMIKVKMTTMDTNNNINTMDILASVGDVIEFLEDLGDSVTDEHIKVENEKITVADVLFYWMDMNIIKTTIIKEA